MLPRFVPVEGRGHVFVPLEDLIASNLHDLFPGMEILDHGYFRVTRDADFEVSDEADDLLQRRRGRAAPPPLRRGGPRRGRVRHDPELRSQLTEALGVEERQVYDVAASSTSTTSGRSSSCRASPELRDTPWSPVTQPRLQAERASVGHLRGDPPRRHPRPSPVRLVLDLGRAVRRAGVEDPDVLAIKMTVYRTSDDTPLIPALIRGDRARQAGRLPRGAQGALRRAGEHRVGARAGGGGGARRLRPPVAEDARQVDPRRPPRGRRRAPLRARRDRQLPPEDGAPVHRLRPVHRRRASSAPTSPTCSTSSPASRARAATARCCVAPTFLRDAILDEIERTIAAHERGEHAADPHEDELARRPARASARCTARRRPGCRSTSTSAGSAACGPGSPGVSDNIRVVSSSGASSSTRASTRSSRGDDVKVYTGSADLMPRNLDTRVELIVPVEDRAVRDDLPRRGRALPRRRRGRMGPRSGAAPGAAHAGPGAPRRAARAHDRARGARGRGLVTADDRRGRRRSRAHARRASSAEAIAGSRPRAGARQPAPGEAARRGRRRPAGQGVVARRGRQRGAACT